LLGGLRHQQGRHAEALELIDAALKSNPNVSQVLLNYGTVLDTLERYDEAIAAYDRALQIKPDDADAHYSRATTLNKLERYEEAVESYDKALAIRPQYPEALYNRGNTFQELKRFDEALASYDRALAVKPDYTKALNNRGNALQALKRFDEALASYDKAIAFKPGYAEALNNRGNTFQELKRFDEALVSYDKALAVQPDNAEALNNRGNTFQELKQFGEALASYDKALVVQADNAEVLNSRSNTLMELKRFDEALASYDRALTLRPVYAEAHWNEALARLLIGDFERGWPKYEWRWKKDTFTSPRRNFPQPLWLGADAIDGKTILLHSEQGFGDTIQFCRYVPLVAARGARVILEVERPLHELMTDLAGAAEIISKGDPPPDCDFQCPLLSLPLAFGTRLETIPSAIPYLYAPVQALKNWQARLGPKVRPRIGLVWSGSPTHKNDHNRSISLRSLIPLLNIEATFVSLQKDVRADDAAVVKERKDILHFGDALKDFSDTAALISQLDLVISVDTSVAHLAGALAKPVWVLLPFVPDWRWLLEREDSPWYPTARLFRQDETRAWDSVIMRVRESLLKFKFVKS
jgi:tetratricopeptide (TPR) repeat protein